MSDRHCIPLSFNEYIAEENVENEEDEDLSHAVHFTHRGRQRDQLCRQIVADRFYFLDFLLFEYQTHFF